MADEVKEEAADEAAGKKVKEKGKAEGGRKIPLKWLVAGVVLTGTLVGGGIFYTKRGTSENKANAEEATRTAAEGSAQKEKADDKPAIFELEPFVVNLADTREIRYLKVTIKLELSKAEFTQEVSNHLPQIRDSLLILLSSKEYNAIRTVEGKMELRDEILRRINSILSKGEVKMAYFTDFVAQ